LRKYLFFLVIAAATVCLAVPLAVQLVLTYMFLRGVFAFSEVEMVYAYEWLASGNDKINLKFETNENIYLHLSRECISFLVPGGWGRMALLVLKHTCPI